MYKKLFLIIFAGTLLTGCSKLKFYTNYFKSPKFPEYQARKLYKNEKYAKAARKYIKAAEKSEFNSFKRNSYYNAACSFALTADLENAIIQLENAIKTGYANKSHALSDTDLSLLYKHPRWLELINSINEIPEALNKNPKKALIITKDVHNFWEAYDKVQTNPKKAKEIFKQYYFDKASRGMDDYMGLKIRNIDHFVDHILSAPKFYKSIRSHTMSVDKYKSSFTESYKNLKNIYPAAKFPNVYFVIGAFTSGGTVSDAGLLIGLNQLTKGDQVFVDELTEGQQFLLCDKDYIKFIVPHELIHFQQKNMKSDPSLLANAIVEGMADFIGELISGPFKHNTYNWAKGKEQQIWKRFKKEMHTTKKLNWISNASRSTKDNPPDQGYWVGYQICKSYYEIATDKNQAIHDMLHIQDYQKFLNDSKWEEKLKNF